MHTCFDSHDDSQDMDGSLDRFYLETDFSKGHVSQILRGKRSPSLTTMVRLARALGVKVGDFFHG